VNFRQRRCHKRSTPRVQLTLVMVQTTPNSDPDPFPKEVPTSTSAYVRLAKPSEIPALVDVYARAFARDPSMNWFGGVRELVSVDYQKGNGDSEGEDDKETSAARRTVEALRDFQLVVVKMAKILGLIVVVVEKTEGGGGENTGEAEERIVGGALWLPPGTSMDPSPLTLVRISPWRTIWSWGLGGLKRTSLEFAPKAEKITDKVFAERGLKRLESWHLLEIAIDPTREGKGYASLLLRDGFKRASGKPMHLEATTPRSRDIYAHMGFELNREHRFGVGSVDDMGIVAKGEAAVGWPVFIMTKWENP